MAWGVQEAGVIREMIFKEAEFTNDRMTWFDPAGAAIRRSGVCLEGRRRPDFYPGVPWDCGGSLVNVCPVYGPSSIQRPRGEMEEGDGARPL